MRDTIDMAREAGLIQESEYFYSPREEEADVHIKDLKAFEALVRADEREACAKAADEHMRESEGKSFGVGAAIRARRGR
jgi:hypothetical protein